MSVEDLDVVDLVSMGPDGRWFFDGHGSSGLDAKCCTHQQKLQKKLNGYMRFIESGQVYQLHPAAKGQTAGDRRIRFLHMPDEDGWKFLERVRTVVERAGVQIQCKMLQGSVK